MEFRFHVLLDEADAFGPIVLETSDGRSTEIPSVAIHGPYRVTVAQDRAKGVLLVAALIPKPNTNYTMQGLAFVETHMQDVVYFELDTDDIAREEDGTKLITLHIAAPDAIPDPLSALSEWNDIQGERPPLDGPPDFQGQLASTLHYALTQGIHSISIDPKGLPMIDRRSEYPAIIGNVTPYTHMTSTRDGEFTHQAICGSMNVSYTTFRGSLSEWCESITCPACRGATLEVEASGKRVGLNYYVKL